MLRDHENEIKEKEKVSEENIEVNIDNANDSTKSGNVNDTTSVKDHEINELNELLSKKEAENKELLDRMQRLAAEFDNFRKRTQKEKDKLYGDAVSEVVAKFLPVADNLERALKASATEENQGLMEGVVLVFKEISDILSKLDVKPIEAVGTTFNPELHNAVMHIEDETLDHNIVVEEFQKGFMYKDEIVIRHSMVKVAN
jgi:molecular chaperone GrpE